MTDECVESKKEWKKNGQNTFKHVVQCTSVCMVYMARSFEIAPTLCYLVIHTITLYKYEYDITFIAILHYFMTHLIGKQKSIDFRSVNQIIII